MLDMGETESDELELTQQQYETSLKDYKKKLKRTMKFETDMLRDLIDIIKGKNIQNETDRHE